MYGNNAILCFPIFILNDLCLHLHVHNRRKLMLIYQRESKRGNIFFQRLFAPKTGNQPNIFIATNFCFQLFHSQRDDVLRI